MDLLKAISPFVGLVVHDSDFPQSPGLLWALHVIADALILLAYIAIPATLVTILLKRRDDVRFAWIFISSGVFVGACGLRHIVEIWSVAQGAYWVVGTLDAVTAIVSVSTTVLLIRLVPKMLALPSPAALQRVNTVLEEKIAEHERAERALRESNRRLDLLSKATSDVVWEWELASGSVWWNENYEHMFGSAPAKGEDDIKAWADRIHPDDAPTVHQSLQALLDGGGDTWSGEYRFRRHDGSWVPVFDRGYVVRDEQGKPVRMLGALQDISAQRQAEATLSAAHHQLLEVSRQAGMAEVATGVLHNVGNALNSVNVSATLVTDRVQRSQGVMLEKVAALMREHAGDLATFLTGDPKGRKLPGFIETLAGQLAKERAGLLDELESLRANVEHIREVVAMQQDYAKVAGVAEAVSLTDVMEDALRFNAGLFTRHGVNVVREYQARPTLSIDKHKTLQILVNVIGNAITACSENGQAGDRRVALRVTANDRRAVVEVADNGMGISTENLTRIFSPEFATRKNGHGFGLHSGAIAAKQLGGSLVAHSDGPGQGAVFILTLPIAPGPAPSN